MSNSTETQALLKTDTQAQTEIVLKSSTVLIYKTLAERIIRRTHAYLQESPEDVVWPTPEDLIFNWKRKFFTSTYNTVNLERSALMWHFETTKPSGWEAGLAILKAHIPRRSEFLGNADQVFTRRSRPPGRMIPEDHLKKLIQYLSTLRTGGMITGQQTQWFILAGIASGARPIEWQTAKWVDEPNGVLRIYTAKVKARNAWDKIPSMTFTADDLDNDMEGITGKSGSLNGENSWYAADFSRRLSGINLSIEELRELHAARYLNGVDLFRDVKIEKKYLIYVMLHLESVRLSVERERKLQLNWPEAECQTDEEIFAKNYYGRIRHCLWRACNSVFKGEEMYSLVDTRSTFSANRKGLVGLHAAAKDLGHTPTTSKDYFAPASKAWTAYKPTHGNATAAAGNNVDGAGQSPAAFGSQASSAGVADS